MEYCFVYQNRDPSSFMVIFSVDDKKAEDYVALENELGVFNSLFLSRNHHMHPFGHQESKAERSAKNDFHLEQWNILAGIYDGQGKTGFASVLLVNKEDSNFALVIETKGYQLIESIYGAWAIENDGLLPQKEALEYFGISSSSPKKQEPAKAERPKNEPEVILPSFTPNKKQGKPRNIEIPKEVPQAKTSKPIDQPYAPEFIAPKDDIEEEVEGVIEVARPSFVANSSKKPRNLDAKPDVKPVPIPKQVVKKEVPDSLVKTAKPVSAITLSFSPISNKKPKNLEPLGRVWKQRPRLTFGPDREYARSRMFVQNYHDTYSLPFFQKAQENLKKESSLTISDACWFSPKIPEDVGWKKAFKEFHADDWIILAMNIDTYNKPISMLLTSRELNGFCFFLTRKMLVTSIGFNGASTLHPILEYEDLCANLFPPVEEAEEEEPVIEEEEIPETVEEEKEEYPEEGNPPLKAHRRVFVSNAFTKDEQRFVDKYHEQAKEDFDNVILSLITLEDETLESFLRSKDAKSITTRNHVTIYKMQFGSSKEYEASRLFYCRGYDVKRHMDSSDYLLLGLSDQGEHDEQGRVAELLARLLDEDKDPVFYQKLLPENSSADFDDLAYMSKEQFQHLEKARTMMPMAFLGSAGTGKTLLSLQHYITLESEGNRVLYLTYQRALCDEVRKTLRELSASDIQAMTYRDLCFSLFGEEVGNTMRTKKRFRKWFKSYADKTGPIQSRLRILGPTREDQFMICYVFYRGIIDGARMDYASRCGRILSRDQFMRLVSDEEGFPNDAKEVVYDIAVAYEKHLQRHGGTTDNKLAYRILSNHKKFQRFDAIVIDEFQDLSEIQFMAIVSLLKPRFPLPLFIYGDENQAINPTIFTYKQACNILRELFGGKATFHQQELTNSFRSGPNLVHYINDVNHIKRLAIGARKREFEAEVSCREDEEDLFATLVEGKENLGKLVSICEHSSKDVVFIFPSAGVREAVAASFGNEHAVFTKSAFLSVEEAKGREWDSVVLVDFFSSSRDLFDLMLGEERIGKHSTVHRMLFNRFYVALTRARNRVVVFESNPSEIIRKRLLTGLTPLSSLDNLSSYFEGRGEVTGWLEFGKKLLAGKKYRDAYRAFSQAQGEEGAALAEICYNYIRADEDELSYEQERDLYLNCLDYERLLALYDDSGLAKHRACLAALTDASVEPSYALEAYQALANKLTNLEKKVFFALCCRKYIRRINAQTRKLFGRK